MNFCEKCGNMYYLKISEQTQDKLVYHCRKCGFIDENLVANEDGVICVSKTHIKKSRQNYSSVINEYTKLDPTLPRIKTIRCPNVECSSNTSSESKENTENEIIFLRYDDNNMKYIYLCSNCDYSWKN